MKSKLITLVFAALALSHSGCATGFRATGPHGGGVAAGAGIGQPVTPPVARENGYLPPPPPPPPPPQSFR